MRGLVVDRPWIDLILAGEKIWEMRKTACSVRGPIALIRKGSGQVVGTATVHGSRPPLLTAEEYAAAEPQHRIPLARQMGALADGWRVPWVLGDAKPLAQPVRYDHPNGAVIWVRLESQPVVVAAVRAQATGF